MFRLPDGQAIPLLTHWLSLASRCRLAKTIRKHFVGIDAALRDRLGNARIRLITRVAFGVHPADVLAALALLSLGACCPALRGRPWCRA